MRKLIISVTIDPKVVEVFDAMATKWGKNRSQMLEIAMQKHIESDKHFSNLLKPKQ